MKLCDFVCDSVEGMLEEQQEVNWWVPQGSTVGQVVKAINDIELHCCFDISDMDKTD